MIETPSRHDRSDTVRAPRRRSSLLPFRRKRHKLTRPGLRNLARARSDDLIQLVLRREACRPRNDAVIKGHEYPHRRVTLHDLETQGIYSDEYAAEISDLRGQFARRGIRNGQLDRYLESPENEADLRTISTALLEMSARLVR
jgi:hypothetical protein